MSVIPDNAAIRRTDGFLWRTEIVYSSRGVSVQAQG